jgi:Phosphoenolpyruvate phosphomutase
VLETARPPWPVAPDAHPCSDLPVEEATKMSDHLQRASRFLALHQGTQPLLLANPWDRGSAVLLAFLGFQALATTSSGFAATLGRRDGSVPRREALEHAAQIVQATDLPVTADLERRTSPAGSTTRSMTLRWLWRGSRPPPRPPTASDNPGAGTRRRRTASDEIGPAPEQPGG